MHDVYCKRPASLVRILVSCPPHIPPCDLVPGLEGQGRSEGLVLKRTVDFMREQMEVRRQLIQEREARGEVVDEKLKEYVLAVH